MNINIIVLEDYTSKSPSLLLRAMRRLCVYTAYDNNDAQEQFWDIERLLWKEQTLIWKAV